MKTAVLNALVVLMLSAPATGGASPEECGHRTQGGCWPRARSCDWSSGRGALMEQVGGSPELDFGNACGIAGGSLHIAAGRGTGTAGGGAIKLQTAPAGAVSKNRKNKLKTALRIDTNYTADNATPMLLWDNRTKTLRRVMVGPADSGGPGFRALVIAN